MTDWKGWTAEEIRAAAREYNAGFEDDIPDGMIENGEAKIRVTCCADRRGGGERFRAIVTPIVGDERGHVDAAEGEVTWLRWFDGRLSMVKTAQRATKFLGLRDAKVTVEFRQAGLA